MEQSASFVCSAISINTASVKYQWEVKSINAQTFDSIDEETSNALDVTGITKQFHGNKYRCRVYNDDGLVTYTKEAVLSVIDYGIEITNRLDEYIYIVDDQTITLEISATNKDGDNPYIIKYQWYKDDAPIEGAISNKYTTKDAGEYYCKVYNDEYDEYAVNSSRCSVVSVYATITDNDKILPWVTLYADVQEAIDIVANKGGEVWIKKGTYKHGSAMTMKNNVRIYGGFAGTETSKDQRVAGNNTILDGENSYRVFSNSYSYSNPLTNSAKLDNVTIQNGYTSGSGAGVYNFYASPEITNCTFANNSASYNGGGMCNYNSSSPVLTNCTFTNNSADDGGVMYNSSSSSPVLTNCTFSGNSASRYGGGMYNSSSSSPVLTNCILWGNIASNSGNEIYNNNSESNCKPTIDTCIIKGGVDEIYGNKYGTYTNIIETDPKLMPLGNYGGSVQTIAVAYGSSAIGKGKVVDGLTTDARGVVRSTDAPTIGAYEYQNKI